MAAFSLSFVLECFVVRADCWSICQRYLFQVLLSLFRIPFAIIIIKITLTVTIAVTSILSIPISTKVTIASCLSLSLLLLIIPILVSILFGVRYHEYCCSYCDYHRCCHYFWDVCWSHYHVGSAHLACFQLRQGR